MQAQYISIATVSDV